MVVRCEIGDSSVGPNARSQPKGPPEAGLVEADSSSRDSGGVPPLSIVIPAHNEQNVLARCLEVLADDPVGRRAEVVVVANGCTDATIEVARGFTNRLARLSVEEVARAGKIGALNAGDARASVFPRLYLDADITLGAGALSALLDQLSRPEPVVASPSVRFDVSRSSSIVSAYFRAYASLPYVQDGLVGLGVYGLSQAGRQRFGAFPEVVADDLFVQRCFDPGERVTTEGEFTVRTPQTLADLLRVRRRSVGGAQQLATDLGEDTSVDTGLTTGSTARALAGIARGRPDLAWPLAVYVLVSVLARLRPVREASAWTRDESSRRPPIGGAAVTIDGLPLWNGTEQQVVDHVMDLLDRGHGGLIATPNVDIMRTDALSRPSVLARMDVLVPDGMPLLWASRLQGTPLTARIAGSDLVWSLCGGAAERHRSVFLLGGAPGVADRAAAAFRAVRPDLRVAGTASPPPGFDSSESELGRLRQQLIDAQPDLVLVAIGAPRQERLALDLARDLPRTWFLGCGGALDMAAGDRGRAPVWMQRAGLEWTHRLRLEPGRMWRRYLTRDAPYAVVMLLRAARRRVTRS